MRVLMTTDTVGGVWTFTAELSRELLASGCAVALVSLGRIPTSSQLDWVAAQVSRWGSKFRFAACDAPLEWMQDNWGAMSEAEPLLKRIVREFCPDILLSSQFCLGALKGTMPRIVVAHSDVLSWAKACRSGSLPSSDWLDRYNRLVQDGLREADAVVAPTRWMLDALAANYQLPEETYVIPNGRTIDSPSRIPSCYMQAITAGRLWDEGKNLKMLSDVKSPIPILVAGETEHEMSYMEESCGQARLLGRLTEEELLEVMRQSTVYICTSSYEPFGLAPLEAALCGCAVVANDIPSLREVWSDAALYFKDSASLSSLLAALAADGGLLARARARSRRRAQQFTARKMAKSYLHLLLSVSQPVLAEHSVA